MASKNAATFQTTFKLLTNHKAISDVFKALVGTAVGGGVVAGVTTFLEATSPQITRAEAATDLSFTQSSILKVAQTFAAASEYWPEICEVGIALTAAGIARYRARESVERTSAPELHLRDLLLNINLQEDHLQEIAGLTEIFKRAQCTIWQFLYSSGSAENFVDTINKINSDISIVVQRWQEDNPRRVIHGHQYAQINVDHFLQLRADLERAERHLQDINPSLNEDERYIIIDRFGRELQEIAETAQNLGILSGAIQDFVFSKPHYLANAFSTETTLTLIENLPTALQSDSQETILAFVSALARRYKEQQANKEWHHVLKTLTSICEKTISESVQMAPSRLLAGLDTGAVLPEGSRRGRPLTREDGREEAREEIGVTPALIASAKERLKPTRGGRDPKGKSRDSDWVPENSAGPSESTARPKSHVRQRPSELPAQRTRGEPSMPGESATDQPSSGARPRDPPPAAPSARSRDPSSGARPRDPPRAAPSARPRDPPSGARPRDPPLAPLSARPRDPPSGARPRDPPLAPLSARPRDPPPAPPGARPRDPPPAPPGARPRDPPPAPPGARPRDPSLGARQRTQSVARITRGRTADQPSLGANPLSGIATNPEENGQSPAAARGLFSRLWGRPPPQLPPPPSFSAVLADRATTQATPVETTSEHPDSDDDELPGPGSFPRDSEGDRTNSNGDNEEESPEQIDEEEVMPQGSGPAPAPEPPPESHSGTSSQPDEYDEILPVASFEDDLLQFGEVTRAFRPGGKVQAWNLIGNVGKRLLVTYTMFDEENTAQQMGRVVPHTAFPNFIPQRETNIEANNPIKQRRNPDGTLGPYDPGRKDIYQTGLVYWDDRDAKTFHGLDVLLPSDSNSKTRPFVYLGVIFKRNKRKMYYIPYRRLPRLLGETHWQTQVFIYNKAVDQTIRYYEAQDIEVVVPAFRKGIESNYVRQKRRERMRRLEAAEYPDEEDEDDYDYDDPFIDDEQPEQPAQPFGGPPRLEQYANDDERLEDLLNIPIRSRVPQPQQRQQPQYQQPQQRRQPQYQQPPQGRRQQYQEPQYQQPRQGRQPQYQQRQQPRQYGQRQNFYGNGARNVARGPSMVTDQYGRRHPRVLTVDPE